MAIGTWGGGARALELELLARLALFVRPVPLVDVFDCEPDLVPRWAVEACDRLVIAGKLRELPGGELEVIDHGAVLSASAA